ncbi:hypothetical protein EW093_14505 [Thiospirochaeta perfilievii]|uniref:Tetratricopeptide repeat protein n=1 Tax=Thiospirochaeta perfilievii TaxID=252967 RepID=A0A5C1QE48_9SPIO|nr:hypothetical protein [Thiospirochaeta perfilievii]QEN05861.1 hypothetical protein EW093_14505 [Thiospirochaeta perfilievii]
MSLLFLSGYLYLSFKNKNSIESQIIVIDSNIESGKLDKAIKLLSKASKNVPDRYSSYRLLKRSINIAESTSNYKVFLDVAFNIVNTFPGNEDLQAYYVMSLLKVGEYDKAKEVALDQLTSSEFKPLLAQTILFSDNKSQTDKDIIHYMEGRLDPSFFEYLASLLNDTSLYINSALLWAKNGELEKAYSLVSNLNSKNIEELISLLAYDTGRRSEALLRLLELPKSDSIKYTNILLIADLLYLKDNYPRSRFYYEKALELDVIDAKPFINITSIYRKLDDIKQAITFVDRGVSLFNKKIREKISSIDELKESSKSLSDPNEIKLSKTLLLQNQDDLTKLEFEYKKLVLLSYHLYKEVNSTSAIKILEDYRELFPNDVKIQLLYLRENNRTIDPAIYQARLWSLLNSDKNSKEVSEFLVWYYLGINDFDNINLILERSENRYPNQSWTKYYRGILEGLHGNYKEGIKLLSSRDIDVDEWELLFNRGILEMGQKNYSNAMELFNKSIIAINQKAYLKNRDVYLSKIKTKIAIVLITLNEVDEAIRVLNSAIELDPNNYTSDLLKSINIDLKESK